MISSETLPSSDQRWRNRVDGLLADLKRQGGEVRREITPQAGAKGGAEAIILALGSSGAIAAAVGVFQTWFNRTPDSAVEFDGQIGGKKVKFKITGRNITEETLREALTRGIG